MYLYVHTLGSNTATSRAVVPASAKTGNLQQFLLKKLERGHPKSCSPHESESVHPGKDTVGCELVDPSVVC